MAYLSSHVVSWNSSSSLLVAPLQYRLWAPLWWIFNKGLFPSPSEELIKAIAASSDEPHHPDLETQLSPPPHNYTCIIRTHIHTGPRALTCVGTYSTHIIKTAGDSPPTRVPATFPPASEPVSQCGAATLWAYTCTESLSQRGGGYCFGTFIFIFQPDNRSTALCLCIIFFPIVFVYLAPLFPPSLPPSVSLHLTAHCLPSDVIAPVQKRRRLGIWWCGACKWSLCQGCLF